MAGDLTVIRMQVDVKFDARSTQDHLAWDYIFNEVRLDIAGNKSGDKSKGNLEVVQPIDHGSLVHRVRWERNACNIVGGAGYFDH